MRHRSGLGEVGAMGELVAIVLAAGQGTRMRSTRTKVLHEVLGRPMVTYPVQAALDAGAERVVVVVGHQGEAVRDAVLSAFPDRDVAFAWQHEQRGTGHAVGCALADTLGFARVLILVGDTPALDAATLGGLVAAHRDGGATLTMTSIELDDPTGYGRVVRDDAGHPARIVEHRDASEAERALREVNAGLYVCDRTVLVEALGGLSTDNAQGEYYLTDIVEVVASKGAVVRGHRLADPVAVLGVNTRAQLADIEALVSRRRNRALMEAGVTMRDPASTRVESDVVIAEDVVLGPQVDLRGRTRIGRGSVVDVGAVLVDCVLADDVHVKPYVVAEGAELGEAVAVGPFAHLRAGTVLGRDAKIGNFVETKKARLGEGSKASHLTYLGDCEIGRDVNVGAGTITCNYDGFEKHVTVIDDGVFVGSDTTLVAPVRVGKNVTIAAATTVVQDVPDGALVISRGSQVVREGYYERHRKPRADAKRAKRPERS